MNKYDEAAKDLERLVTIRMYNSFYLTNEAWTGDVCCLAWKGKDGFCALTATSDSASGLLRDIDHVLLPNILYYALGYAQLKKYRLSDNIMAQGAEAVEILDAIRVCETLFMEGDQK